MNGATHNNLIALRDRFRALLVTAARERDRRSEFVPTQYGKEPAWVLHEQGVLLAEVNRVRVDRGLPPVDADLIARADSHAAGHTDWLDKLSLYCAEIVSDPDGRWPVRL